MSLLTELGLWGQHLYKYVAPTVLNHASRIVVVAHGLIKTLEY